MKQWYPITVRTYAGYRGEESPRSFHWNNVEYSISRIRRQANEQTTDRRSFRRFQVLTTTDETFDLIQDVESAGWYIEIED